VLGLCNGRIEQELQAGKIVIVAGFQGISGSGDITTLGRGGSDTTAVALAAFLKADLCRIYTDVDGVYDKDPRKHPDAVLIPRISYEDMLALARQGAQVLHDRCVELAQLYRVPVQVLSSFRSGSGTLVTDLPEDSSQS
jgi:aspartate kinase